MLGSVPQAPAARSAAIITGLTLLALGAMASAIPPARLAPEVTGFERGYLVSEGGFSDMLAELLNGDGYTYIAIDLSRAALAGDAPWRGEFDSVSRIFPVWAFVDARGGAGQARKVAATLPLQGILLYGARPADVEAVRAAKPGLRVVPVVRAGETREAEYAVALPPERFAAEASKTGFPMLLADRLGEAGIAKARAAAPGNYLVCAIAILD